MEFAALDFMNSYWRDYRGSGRREDRLDEAGWLEGFLRRWGLEPSASVAGDEVERLRALRALLWRIAERLDAGAEPEPTDLAALDEAIAAAPLRRRLARDEAVYRLRLEPAVRDWTWVRAEIAASFADLLATHEAARVKLCANDDCRWAFYDESKSRSRRWCADVCGNLMKVRKFRERSRASHAGDRARKQV